MSDDTEDVTNNIDGSQRQHGEEKEFRVEDQSGERSYPKKYDSVQELCITLTNMFGFWTSDVFILICTIWIRMKMIGYGGLFAPKINISTK